jgi:proteasome lid subunit RPN8/RPN11
VRHSMRRALVIMARNEFPKEVCGFIRHSSVNGNQMWMIHPITNVADEVDQFEMDETELIDFYKNFQHLVVGMYHSHPNGRRYPSKTDTEYAPENMRYWIVTREGVFEWDMTGDKPQCIEIT